MYKKYISVFSLVFVFVLGLYLNPVLAKTSDNGVTDEIPEQEGTYDVPKRPDLKVRVFVHNPKPVPSPVLTCDDPGSSAKVRPAGWKLPSNWTYTINTGSAPSSVASGLTTISDLSFKAWTNEINKVSSMTIAKNPDTAATRQALDYQNIIAWGRTSGTALAVTYIWYTTATPHIVVDVDTIMNKKFSWSWTPYASGACGISNTYDAQNILTHEIGHWMGLTDEKNTSYGNNTMYAYGSKAEIKKDTLTSGDIDGLSAIYNP